MGLQNSFIPFPTPRAFPMKHLIAMQTNTPPAFNGVPRWPWNTTWMLRPTSVPPSVHRRGDTGFTVSKNGIRILETRLLQILYQSRLSHLEGFTWLAQKLTHTINSWDTFLSWCPQPWNHWFHSQEPLQNVFPNPCPHSTLTLTNSSVHWAVLPKTTGQWLLFLHFQPGMQQGKNQQIGSRIKSFCQGSNWHQQPENCR